jgi:predicted helicase
VPATRSKANRALQGKLIRWMVAQARELKDRLAGDEHADDIAQAAACAAPILATAGPEVSGALAWLCGQLDDWEQRAIELAVGWATPTASPIRDALVGTVHPTAHLYDQFLHRYLANTRKRRGVYFTPPEIANYIVAQIDRLLKEDFDLPSGLAHTSSNPQSAIQNPQSPILFLDPACGAGVFLLAAIDHLQRQVKNWNDFVPSLLPRLIGLEILPAAALLAKLNLTLKLAATGYHFQPADRLRIITADALVPTLHSEFCILNSRIPIVLGNPPFSCLTTKSNDWIANLVRGNDDIRGYVRANGQVLGERKTWLHDDYVKFLRLAQWHVEEAGCGIVGFVTNHGYLDNATFRLMRHELLRVFPRVKIVDLHGSRKNYEVSPDGTKDENVFHLDQGVAISLLSRPPSSSPQPSFSPQAQELSGIHSAPSSRLEYSELWGSRAAKLNALTHPLLQVTELTPATSDWLFIPKPLARIQPEYDSAWSLADAMPVNTPAPVTARDHFVVAFTREELEQRIAEFRDLSIPDDEIRARYLHRTRSARYQSGDTRSWKLTEARRLIAAEPNWQRYITRCLYRPFDWRYVFWHPAMIDWPREAVTRHLVSSQGNSEFRIPNSETDIGDNHSAFCILHSALCLIARRQQLPSQPCTFFWISDGLALDGVIRSDNRGSESLFPLHVVGTLRVPSPNFAPEFVENITSAIRLRWQPAGAGDLQQTFGPADLLAYIYALFHAPTYRERYAESLRRDFPRIIAPKSAEPFAAMSRLGRQLIDLHLLRQSPDLGPWTLDLGPHIEFRVGGYEVLRKWLQPKHRTTTDPEYMQIHRAVTQTQRLMQEIDRVFVSKRQ